MRVPAEPVSERDPVAAHALSRPDHPAVITVGEGPDEVTTFATLDDHANRLANLLCARGVEPGDCVAVMLPNGAAWFEANLAVARLQARLVPVNWHLTAPEITWILDHSGARVLVGLEELARAAGVTFPAGGCRPVWAGPDRAAALAASSPEPPATAGLAAPALVLYTSGTTGRPKGVVHDQSSTARTRSEHVALWGFGADDVHLLAGPAYHGAPWSFAVSHLALGATVVALTRWDASRFVDAIGRHRATNTFLVPTHFRTLLDVARARGGSRLREQLSSLRLVLHGAAHCPVALKREILDLLAGTEVWEFYGFSEAGRVTRIGPDEWRTHPGSCGRPIDDVRVVVLDDDGDELAPGVTGTVWVVPAGSPFHYAGDPSATASVTRATRWGTAVTGGDVGHVDHDGYLYLSDRSVDLIVRGGVNVYPREVENALLEHPGVADCAVFGVPDDHYGERVMALVEPASHASAGDPQVLDAHCRSRLATFKCPEYYRFVASLPRDPNGKVRKARLRADARTDLDLALAEAFDLRRGHS
jgi:long-chain acyl-CoA synthetase